MLGLATIVPRALAAVSGDASGAASASMFDESMLRARGIDPTLANSLSRGSRFATGVQTLSLVVNGRRLGQADITIDENGDACFDSELLRSAGVLVPDEHWRNGANGCYDIRGRYPGMLIEADPENLTLGLVVPTDAIQSGARSADSYDRGGTAALLNYDVFHLNNHASAGTNRYWSASTEVGLNAGEWMFRSRQIESSQNGKRRSAHLEAYVERTFVDQQITLQAGQINAYNPVVAGARIEGVQLATEFALAARSQQGARVEGIANARARVEVRQNGSLIYSTVVPAGHFVLEGIHGLTGQADLIVSLFEEDGSERSFVVPQVLAAPTQQIPGFTMAAGRLRDVSLATAPGAIGRDDDTWVATGGWTSSLGRQATVAVGGVVASQYQALGANVGIAPWQGAHAQFGMQHSRSQGQRTLQGHQWDISFSQKLNDRWAINGSASARNAGFRDLLDSQRFRWDDQALGLHYKSRYSVASSWSDSSIGGLSVAYSRNTLFDGRALSRGVATWNRQFGHASFSLSAEWSLGAAQAISGNSVYASLSVPIGRAHRVRASARRNEGHTRAGFEASGRINDAMSYRSGIYRDGRTGSTQASAGLSVLPRYAQLDINISRNGADQSSYQAGLRGGIALHSQGVTLSPYPIRETFAVVKVGEVPGVKIATPAGPVWTDRGGRAVVAHVAPFRKSTVQVEAKHLPRNIELQGGVGTLSMARGAVQQIEFAATRTRRALLNVTTPEGRLLPKGAPVTDGDGRLMTLVQEGGAVFLTGVDESQKYWVMLPDKSRCALEFSMPAQDTPDAFFERVQAICRPH